MRVPWDRSKGAPEPLSALDRVRLEECGEPLVRIGGEGAAVVISRESAIPLLRERAAAMLEAAARSLAPRFKIGVVDAWRPIERQRLIYDWFMECAREAFPKRSMPALKRTVNRMVHAYDRKTPPGHCTGGAVDVHLLDAEGNTLDVSAPYDRFWASRTYSLGLTEEAVRLRMTLVNAMLDAGFSNCRDEWWHYSFGDAAWSVRTGRDVCYYGLVELPGETYAREQAIWLEHFRERPNPFLDQES